MTPEQAAQAAASHLCDPNRPFGIDDEAIILKHFAPFFVAHTAELAAERERAEKAEAEAAAMRECLSLLPSGPCGGKMERADYYACVGGDVLLKCMQTLVSGTAGRDILERLKAAEEKADRIERAAERAVAERNGCIESLKASLAASQREVERLGAERERAEKAEAEAAATTSTTKATCEFCGKWFFADPRGHLCWERLSSLVQSVATWKAQSEVAIKLDQSITMYTGENPVTTFEEAVQAAAEKITGTTLPGVFDRFSTPSLRLYQDQLYLIIRDAFAPLLASEAAELERQLAELEAERRWVPVGKRLPGMDGKYLVCEGDRVESATFVSRERWPWEWGDGTTSDPEAWQPLPPAPEKVRKERDK